jgi:WhiB family transcriptional regulator, redox-sensing transcriptional regulator
MRPEVRAVTAVQWSPGAAGPVLRLFDELTETDTGWQDRALCAETDPEAFFPDKGQPTSAAKRTCARCEVSAQCLAYAMDVESRPEVYGRFGVWGGLAGYEREALALDWPVRGNRHAA